MAIKGNHLILRQCLLPGAPSLVDIGIAEGQIAAIATDLSGWDDAEVQVLAIS
jgi:hypothetical protein